jgi:hemolysin activation/secretion protein
VIGGAHSVRGYYEAEELGDTGGRGALELHAPDLLPGVWKLRLAPLLFFNYAHVSFRDPLPGQPASATLRSWGAGADLAATRFLSASVDWAYPMVSSTHTHKGDGHWEFAVRGTW